MKILIVRHGIAQDLSPSGDRGRRLTREGRDKFEVGATALAELVPELELVAASPLARARETADLLAAAYSEPPERVDDEVLAPEGSAAAVVRFLAARKRLDAVAVVGHEPNLSRLEALLVTGHERSFAELKKGGAALVELAGGAATGAGTLLWHLTAGQLRGLAQ